MPFLLMWAYLYISRTQNLTSDLSENLAWGVCVLNGLGAIAALPIQKVARIFAAVIYIPAISGALFLFGLGYVCASFNACL